MTSASSAANRPATAPQLHGFHSTTEGTVEKPWSTQAQVLGVCCGGITSSGQSVGRYAAIAAIDCAVFPDTHRGARGYSLRLRDATATHKSRWIPKLLMTPAEKVWRTCEDSGTGSERLKQVKQV